VTKDGLTVPVVWKDNVDLWHQQIDDIITATGPAGTPHPVRAARVSATLTVGDPSYIGYDLGLNKPDGSPDIDGVMMWVTLYDPTESRIRTRLPQEVIKAGRVLVGLEEVTGADLLVTRVKNFNIAAVSETMPAPLKTHFRNACNAGVLIQRKSGRDLLSSFHKLNETYIRMRDWCEAPILLSTGVIGHRNGKVTIDGDLTKVNYSSMVAKLLFWQWRGGYFIPLVRDSDIIMFVGKMESRWLHHSDERWVMKERPPVQTLLPAGWWERIGVLPGFREAKSRDLAEYPGVECMADALVYLSNDKNYVRTNHPRGVGPADFRNIREWLGLKPGERLVVERDESQ
jgi:hypothetical protein